MKETEMRDEERLLRQLEVERGGVKPPVGAEAARLDARLDARLATWRSIADDLGTHGAESFGPAFRGLLLERIREGKARGETGLYGQLRWMSARVAVAGVAAALVLGAYNATGGYETAGTFVDNVFGLPTPGLEAAILLAGDSQ